MQLLATGCVIQPLSHDLCQTSTFVKPTVVRDFCGAKIIITINFYGAYIHRNLSSEAQQNRINKHNREQGRTKVNNRTRDNRRFMDEMQFGINVCFEVQMSSKKVSLKIS